MLDTNIELTEDEKIFLGKVPEDGRAIGNVSLRNILKWEASKYVEVKKSLIKKNVLQPGRGRGGSVSRDAKVTSQGTPDITQAGGKKKEKEFYPIFQKALETWAEDQEWTDWFIEHNPFQEKKNTGGMWTRPDFVVVGHKRYEYTPGTVRDIESFELKTENFSIDAVFETASHSRFATKSYLVICGDEKVIDEQLLRRTELECQRFEIGLFVFDSSDPNNWIWHVDAVRKEPDPDEVEQFIEKQFNEEHKKQMRNWF
jgi:hypothetical protein